MSSNLNLTRHATPKGIQYALTSGPEIVFNNHGESTLQGTYRVFVEDVQAFIAELMPSPVQVGARVTLDPTLKISNNTGRPNIYSPVRASIKAFQDELPVDYFSFDPLAPAGTYNTYAAVTIDYCTNFDSFFARQRSNEEPVNFLEPAFSTTAEVVSYKVDKNITAATSTSSAATSNAIKDFSAPLTKIIPISEKSYRWTWALNPDFDLIFSLIGWLNATALAWMPGSTINTVMFMGINGKQEYRPALGGARIIAPWNLEYKFAQRIAKDIASVTTDNPLGIITWNHFFNPDTGTFQILTRPRAPGATSKIPLYSSGDFSNLFRAKTT